MCIHNYVCGFLHTPVCTCTYVHVDSYIHLVPVCTCTYVHVDSYMHLYGMYCTCEVWFTLTLLYLNMCISMHCQQCRKTVNSNKWRTVDAFYLRLMLQLPQQPIIVQGEGQVVLANFFFLEIQPHNGWLNMCS